MNAVGGFAEYQKGRVADADPVAMLSRYELSEEGNREVVKAIKAAGMVALATPFSLEDVGVVGGLGLGMVKIASPDVVNYPLLGAVARLKRPMLLSTGAATMEEIEEAVGWVRGWGASFSLLHCVSSYPTPTEETHLSWIGELAQRFAGVAVGYSDHSLEVISGALAVAGGAVILERHLTYDKGASGPDHSASSDPGEFAEYVRLARMAHRMMGEGAKRVLGIEEDVRKVSRQSLVAARDLAAGQVIGEGDLKTQRPGTGMPARLFRVVVGRQVKRAVKAGVLLEEGMLV
jgi:N-acetylneuraminate synthase/N,N'-diacetyllegionaminate synthase